MKGSVCITRPSGRDAEVIKIAIQDLNSRITFVEVEIQLADFAAALTGLSHVPCDLRVSGLANVGKVKVREDRQIECPLVTFDKTELAKWLQENAQEDGWHLDLYLGSQSSVSRIDEKTLLRYAVYKFVEPGHE